MTTLNTIIEEEKKEFEKEFAHCKPANEHTTGYIDSRDYRDIETFLTTTMQRTYEAGRTDSIAKIPMLRQWLNEDKITDVNRMVTNEQIRYWLTGEE